MNKKSKNNLEVQSSISLGLAAFLHHSGVKNIDDVAKHRILLEEWVGIKPIEFERWKSVANPKALSIVSDFISSFDHSCPRSPTGIPNTLREKTRGRWARHGQPALRKLRTDQNLLPNS
jgi:hypothetical protein